MSFSKDVLRSDELAIYDLRELYRKFGYSQYKVSRFEEYDLYARNKSFLVSENILTFTDTNGKLMALKPDVTLSIIKNISADDKEMYKLYYNENVYRTSAESHGFKEIVQTGLECIGSLDVLDTFEVVYLAAKSLDVVSSDFVLDISHIGVFSAVLDAASDNKAFKKWWKQITDANLEPEIAKSTYIAMEIYNKNPQKRTLDKIAQLNPSAAEMIQQQLNAQKKKK
jgi:ATP phosphoribosyltransferase regulatory subunit